MTSRKRILLVVILLILTVAAAVGVDAWLRKTSPSPTIGSLPANDELAQFSQASGQTTTPADHTRSIRGQVIKPSGEPASGAQIRIQGTGDKPAVEVVADLGGAFRVDELELGLYAVEASMEGFGPAQLIGVFPGGAPLRLVLMSGRELTGQLSRRGQVLGEGIVHVGGPGMFPSRAQRVDAGGHYRVSGLRPGTLEAIATAPGLSSGFVQGIVVDSEGGATHDFEMLLAPKVTLRITDKGNGDVIDSGVVTISPRPLHVLSMNTQIFFGEAVIDFLPPGEYWLRVRAPGYMPHDQRFWVTQGGGQQEITLSQGARISGQVVDQAGNPLKGVSLRAILDTATGGKFDLKVGVFETFHGLARPDGTTFWWPTSSYTTNAEGRFTIGGIPAGNAMIIAHREGFATGMSPSIVVQHDQSYEDVRVVLERGRALRGRVENANGRALAGAVVSAVPASIPAWVSGRSLVTDGTGSFVFQELPSKVRITVRHPRHGVAQQVLEIGERGLDDHVIRLEVDSLTNYSGRILVSPAGSSAGARIWFLRRDNNIPVCFAVADDKGLFEATHCSALAERVIVYKDGYAPLTGDAPKPEEAREFVLRQGGELDIVAQRFPMAVAVQPDFHLPDEAWRLEPFMVDRWKRHNLKLLAPGNYIVTCQAEGYAASTIRVRVAFGERAEAVCPFPHRVSTLEVAVLDTQNAPVANAVVWVEGLSSTPTRMSTGPNGRIQIDGPPDRWVRLYASHESWGSGELATQLPKDPSEPQRLTLSDPVGGKNLSETTTTLRQWGLNVVPDNRSLIIDDVRRGSPAENVGFRRGDKLLWVRPEGERRLSVGVRRRSDIVTHVMVQGEP